jgi:hypothetical protein
MIFDPRDALTTGNAPKLPSTAAGRLYPLRSTRVCHSRAAPGPVANQLPDTSPMRIAVKFWFI